MSKYSYDNLHKRFGKNDSEKNWKNGLENWKNESLDKIRGSNTKEYWEKKHNIEYIPDKIFTYDDLDNTNYHKVACDIITQNKNAVKRKSVLDIGCARGDFINILSKKIPEWDFLGYDISQTGIDFANKNFGVKNHIIFETFDVLQDKIPEDFCFAFICMFETLEHIPQPYNYQILDEVLNRCEYAIISVPSTVDHCFGEHISHYNINSFDEKGYNVIWKCYLDTIDMSNVGDYNDYFHFIVLLKGKL